MKQRIKLPVLSKETLSEIAYGMENQEFESVFCLDDGNVYPQEMLEESFDDVDSHNFVSLPDWTSADGYRLMCSFVQVCDDEKLRNELSHALNSGARGVFRRFRAVLESHEGALSKWYEFKDRKMCAYIVSWYRRLFNNKDIGIEKDADDLPAFEIMANYDIVHQESIEADVSETIKREVSDPVVMKVLEAFSTKEAFCAYKDGSLCGTLAFEVVGDAACVLFYYIEKGSRGAGLFELLFDFMNRELERRGVERVAFPIPSTVLGLGSMLDGREVGSKVQAQIREYRVADWNEAVESAEIAYIV